jgi:UDP-N-acetylglucosamine 1-carboxyvinyltransferase
MAKFIIEGPNLLSGEIEVRGSKNTALKIFAASILFQNSIGVQNVPLIDDIFKTTELLKKLGSDISKTGERSFLIDGGRINSFGLDEEIAKHFRASIVFAGPLLARFGKAVFPYPGGCVIGKRPIDFFLDGFSRLGVKISESGRNFYLSAKELKGAEIIFPQSSVTATETLLLAAIGAKGKTVLKNAAMEPEIKALAQFLKGAGAKIEGAGTPTLVIKGLGGSFKGFKTQKNFKFAIPPDRIEAGTFAILGALAAKKLIVKNVIAGELANLFWHLEKMGIDLKIGKNYIAISRPKKILCVNLKTSPYPGFPTDLQPSFAVLLTQAKGESLVFETVFEGRLNYVSDLNKIGGDIIQCDPHRIIVNGPTRFYASESQSLDLRSGLAIVLASLIAKGRSVIHNISHIDRGYEKIEERLQKIGAKIKREE